MLLENTLCINSVIATLWEVSVEAIAKVVDDSHKRNLPVYSRLYDTLKSLREFYYCDGAGVSIRALDSEAYSVCNADNIICMIQPTVPIWSYRIAVEFGWN